MDETLVKSSTSVAKTFGIVDVWKVYNGSNEYDMVLAIRCFNCNAYFSSGMLGLPPESKEELLLTAKVNDWEINPTTSYCPTCKEYDPGKRH